MVRVYVSSTFNDLREHREAVRHAIRRLGHEDIAMEHYVAEDVRPVEKCLADVRSANLYIVIMAWRYGFIPPGDDNSITEQEYRAALDAGVPCLAFVLSEDEPWPPKLVEMERLDKVRDFRTELMQERITGLFTSKDDLARQVVEGIHKWARPDGTVSSTVDWDAYRQAVVERYRYVRLSVIAGAQHDRMARIPLLDVFVPQQLRSGRPNYDLPENEAGPALSEDSIAVLGREPKQVVLGGPGSGKSTLLQASLLAVSDVSGDESRVPVPMRDLPLVLLIELREYVLMGSSDFLSYLESSIWTKYNVRVNEAQLIEAVSSGAVVFFDGLDEIFEPAVRARVVDQFQAFTSRFSIARVAVSSRIVGYDETELGLAGFEHYTLLDFGLKEIRAFVPAWYEHYTLESDERDAAGLIRRVTDNPRLLELAGNPLLLTMMAVIYKHQDLPEKRWQLYDRCTGVLLEDWDVKRKRIDTEELLPLGFPLGRDQKAEILENIAMAMLSAGGEGERELNAIAYEPLRDIIGAYLERQYAKPRGEAKAIAAEILSHLRERTYILAETGDRIFGFVHRTFMEYFAAKYVLAEFNRRKADYEWLKGDVFREHRDDDQWREPLLLLSGMLAGQGSPIREIVTAVADLRSLSSLTFAARCLGETGSAPAEDQAWAAGMAEQLVRRLLHVSPKGDYRADHAAEVVSALASLSSFVKLTEETRRLIRKCRSAVSVNTRMIGFQLELAVASREERRRGAITGLYDEDEAVRRAAVALLDREPGEEAVMGVLLNRLAFEKNSRVREPLIAALERGWPGRKETLDIITASTPADAPSRHALWVADHVAIVWAGDVAAREFVLRLATTAFRNKDLRAVDAIASSLVKGWGSSADFAAFLQREVVRGSRFPEFLAVFQVYEKLNMIFPAEQLWENPSAVELVGALLHAASLSGHLGKALARGMVRHPELFDGPEVQRLWRDLVGTYRRPRNSFR